MNQSAPKTSVGSEPSLWALLPLLKALVVRPKWILTDYFEGSVSNRTVFTRGGQFWLIAGVLYAMTMGVAAYVHYGRVDTNVLGITGLALLMVLVATACLTLLWAAFQKTSAWFWNVPLSFVQVLAVASLGLGYYVWMFLFSLPAFFFDLKDSILLQGILFTFNVSAAILSIRLFCITYGLRKQMSLAKAIWLALFPLLLALLVWVALRLLTYFAVLPYIRSS
jgi:hypothetical protein